MRPVKHNFFKIGIKRAYILIIMFYITLGTVSAQFSRPINIGAGAGGTFPMTDLPNKSYKFAFYGEADYLLNPFISVGLHGEKGILRSAGYNSNSKNDYYAGNINGKVRLGIFMNQPNNYSYYTLQASTLSRILSNIYIGAGAGLVKNRIKAQLTSNYSDAIEGLGGEIASDRSGIHFVIPLNVGVDIPFGRTLYGPKWAVNVNYQHTLTTNDNLDGIINKNNDQYGFVSLGVKYALFNRK